MTRLERNKTLLQKNETHLVSNKTRLFVWETRHLSRKTKRFFFTRNETHLLLRESMLNRPFAGYDHMVQKPPYWNTNCALGHSKQRRFKLE